MEGVDRKPQVSQYGSVDPAPPQTNGLVSEWTAVLCDESQPMFQRMRAVFSLRNQRTDEACLALCQGFSSSSALLRHEIAYVLGQMQNPAALPTLTQRLEDANEHVMVRHEAAEALGAIGGVEVEKTLVTFRRDPEAVINESCMVALDTIDYWNDFKQTDTKSSGPVETAA